LEARAEERRGFDQPWVCVFGTPPRPGIASDSPGHQNLNVFPCRNLSVQKNLQRVCFGVTGRERHGGTVVAPLVFIGLQQGMENGWLGKKLSQLYVTVVAAGGLTGPAGFSSEEGHIR